MRALKSEPPTVLTLLPEGSRAQSQFKSKLKRFLRSLACILLNGSHELYVSYKGKRMYQSCILCNYETKGVILGDQHLHLVRRR